MSDLLRTRFVTVVLTIAALWFVFASLKWVSYLEDQQHTSESFAADQINVLDTTATVTAVSFSKDKKSGGTTSAEVVWADGRGSDHIYLSDSEDVRFAAPVGHRLPVVVWRAHVIRFEFAGEWHTTDHDPAVELRDLRILFCVFLAGAVVCGRISTHGWLDDRVDQRRFLAGDLLVLPFAITTVAVATTSHLDLLTCLVPVTIGALLIAAFVLPALPWMRAPGKPIIEPVPGPARPDRAPPPPAP